MKIALFASGAVGSDVAAVLCASSAQIELLVLDGEQTDGSNSSIVTRSGVALDRVVTSDALYDPLTLARFASLRVDLGLLAWWPHLIRPPLLGAPQLGFLNFHPSLLPYDRGKHYNFWTIVEQSPFGVTLHWITDGIDDGDIAFQAPLEKIWEDTGETLYGKAQTAIVELFERSLPRILAGDIPRLPQPAGQGSFHLAREIDAASRIDLDATYTARTLLDLIRARTFRPHPGAWFEEDGARYEVRIDIERKE